MAVHIRASKDLDLSVVILSGVVAQEEFDSTVVPRMDQPDFIVMSRTLIDATEAETSDASGDAVRGYARQAAKNVDSTVHHSSKVAIAAPNDEFYGFGRMYQMLREGSPVEVRVFRSRNEAEQWLDLPGGYDAKLTDVD